MTHIDLEVVWPLHKWAAEGASVGAHEATELQAYGQADRTEPAVR